MPPRGVPLSAEAKAKISAARRGRPLSDAHRAAISHAQPGPRGVWFQCGAGRWGVRCRDGSYHLWSRIVAWNEIGRELLPSEIAHHLNLDCGDDRPENLEVLSGHAEHARVHREMGTAYGFTDEDRARGRRTLVERAASLTHCKHGHPFDATNTYVEPNGKKACRTCNKERTRRYKSQRVEAEASGAGLRRAA